jgi:hypothetical protein
MTAVDVMRTVTVTAALTAVGNMTAQAGTVRAGLAMFGGVP